MFGSVFAGLIVSVLATTFLVVLAVARCGLTWLVLGNANSSIVATIAIFMSAFTALSWALMTGVFALFVKENNRANASGTIIGSGIGTSLAGYLSPFFITNYSWRIELEQTVAVAGNVWITIGLVGIWGGLLMGYLADKFAIRKIVPLACLCIITISLLYAGTFFCFSKYSIPAECF